MNSLLQHLNKCRQQNLLVRVDTEADNGRSYWVGLICDIGEDELLLHLIDECGRHDGFRLFDISRLNRVVSESRYLRILSKYAVPTPSPCRAAWPDVLAKMKETGELIVIRTANDDDFTGILADFDEEYLTMEEWDPAEGPNGTMSALREDICEIGWGTPRLKVLRESWII